MKTNDLKNYLAIIEELEKDKEDLRKKGLSEEEIEGYSDFYQETFFPIQVRKDLD